MGFPWPRPSCWDALVAAEIAQAACPLVAAHRSPARGPHLVETQPTRARGEIWHVVANLETPMLHALTAGYRCTQHTDPLPAKDEIRARIRRVSAHHSRELVGRPGEVELALRGDELRRERHFSRVLGTADQLPFQVARQLSLQKLAAHPREPLLELAAGLALSDPGLGLRQDRSSVELAGALHQGDARLVIARQDRVRNGRGAPPSWEQRGMNVERPAGDRIDERFRDAFSVCGPHHELGAQREQRREVLASEPFGLKQRETKRAGRLLDRGFAHDPPRTRTVGLRGDADDVDETKLRETIERLERGHGELWRAEKEEARR